MSTNKITIHTYEQGIKVKIYNYENVYFTGSCFESRRISSDYICINWINNIMDTIYIVHPPNYLNMCIEKFTYNLSFKNTND